ncbi:Sushi domain-containing protein 3 [Channa argus]|uniref:Sushi domain-containing protein 3 n=1 Tax=Channa argus TaxID=215402 RepID=A0A6G1Q3I3_CHAAH|nr:Sushi domain-containing protein 3 [Channa argus]
MSAATASIVNGSRTDSPNRGTGRERKNSGPSQTQCSPMPLPVLGTQKIIHGNGTSVGTIISLQCPAKHKLVGSQLKCVMATNSTHWVGQPYCKPVSPLEDYGFRVAVLASIVSSAIIFLMSMAFITCCMLSCIKEDKRKKEERESDMWQWEEQAQHQEDNRSHHNHKGRNNNNNTQEKMLPLWDGPNPAMCDSFQACRCHQAYSPACTYSATPSLAALPCQDYEQPLLHQIPEPAQISGPPQYLGPTPSTCQTIRPGLVQISATGPSLLCQNGGQERRLSSIKLSTPDESKTRNTNSKKEFSVRIISV